jgi:uncharacterized protein (DUF2384 family)
MPENGVSPGGETPESLFAPSQNPDVNFSIDKDRRLVVVKFEGSVTLQEIARYVESLVAHPDFDPSFSEITDLRAVEHFDLQANDFLTLADQIDPFSLTARRAFVVRTSAQNQVARMHKFLRPHRTIDIFESVAQAEEWLGL